MGGLTPQGWCPEIEVVRRGGIDQQDGSPDQQVETAGVSEQPPERQTWRPPRFIENYRKFETNKETTVGFY